MLLRLPPPRAFPARGCVSRACVARQAHHCISPFHFWTLWRGAHRLPKLGGRVADPRVVSAAPRERQFGRRKQRSASARTQRGSQCLLPSSGRQAGAAAHGELQDICVCAIVVRQAHHCGCRCVTHVSGATYRCYAKCCLNYVVIKQGHIPMVGRCKCRTLCAVDIPLRFLLETLA